MSVVIDHEAVKRQLVEIDKTHREREHSGDLRRRRAIQGLSALGLIGSGARELYRREYLDALPTARFLLGEESDAWRTTMHPTPESVHNSVAETSAHVASIALSGLGDERRADSSPWLSVASAGFLAIRAVAAGRQLLDELEDGELDVFTTLNAVTSAASVPLAIPETMRAIRGIFSRRDK